MKLSVLDQAPISSGDTPETSLQHSVELAKYTEDLGFHRYWMAEHHNTNGLASSAPEIAIGQILQHTESIRVGSGGVLLPQYSPLKVAETFRMLEAFHPGRVDLGLGRSPGGGQKTRAALTDGGTKPLSSFSRQVKELQQFLNNDLPKGHDYFGVKVKPETKGNPSVWVLGLSERGAKHAALNGTGFTFGYFISPSEVQEAINVYRERFTPKYDLKEPHVTMCIFAVCADTQEEAEYLAKSQDYWLLQVEEGLDTRVHPPEAIDLDALTEEQRRKLENNRNRCVIGTPAQVAHQLTDLSELYNVDEFLLITNIFSFEKKKLSYKKIKQALDTLE
ncbi:LLM class flavin-dependent oxidoreductase [Salimicrobium sp. PL1-032A]|uniref:LLM class flavin-dependent oxidoreductase n=1 Tax=Salimicrobium sp. PL1-032A TaxID=3095364 RepID=UPI003261697F